MPHLPSKPVETLSYLQGASTIFVSLNRFDSHIHTSFSRYERKKNILLALQAFDLLLNKLKEMKFSLKTVKLVIAGGYDSRVQENIEYYEVAPFLSILLSQELANYANEKCLND